MNNVYYPPLIDGKLPAFTYNELNKSIIIPFHLSKAVSKNNFDTIKVIIKTIAGGVEKYKNTTKIIN